MAFLQPYWLWGMLAVAIPVAIHFWYQKRGKILEWAAMRWLGEQITLQNRGLRLNEVLLMLLRCLLVLLLALILSKPIIDWLKNAGASEIVHLVQPDRLVSDTYRFELQKALGDGEKVYWLGTSPEAVDNLGEMPAGVSGLAHLQQNINALAGGNEKHFKLYFKNDFALNDFPKIYTPGEYQLFPAVDSAATEPVSFLENKSVHKKIHVLLENDDAAELETIAAALTALSEVHGFAFEVTQKNSQGAHYDWTFTNKPVRNPEPETIYVVSGNTPEWNLSGNVIPMRYKFRLADSELVESGRFPEWLGDLLVKRLKANHRHLSNAQLHALFTQTPALNAQNEAMLRPWLLLVFLGLMVVERWLALHKTVKRHG